MDRDRELCTKAVRGSQGTLDHVGCGASLGESNRSQREPRLQHRLRPRRRLRSPSERWARGLSTQPSLVLSQRDRFPRRALLRHEYLQRRPERNRDIARATRGLTRASSTIEFLRCYQRSARGKVAAPRPRQPVPPPELRKLAPLAALAIRPVRLPAPLACPRWFSRNGWSAC